MSAQTARYKLSLVAGGLFYREALQIAELYVALDDWAAVRQKVLTENLLHARVRASLVRTTREVIQRLQTLTDAQRQILVDGSRQEQNQILWLAVCKQYVFVHEFAVEIVREKYLRLDLEVTPVDFDRFFHAKAEWNESLAQITTSTRKKVRQVVFRILGEAGIVTEGGLILPVMLSPRVARAIAANDPGHFAIFPLSDADIQKGLAA